MNLCGLPPYQKGTKRPKRENDDTFLEWLSYQPSAIDAAWNQWDDIKGGRNIACHVRRIKRGSGIGHKPKYSAIPMTDAQHQIQTKYGEAACLNMFHRTKRDWTEEEAAQWFEDKADAYAQAWRESRGL